MKSTHLFIFAVSSLCVGDLSAQALTWHDCVQAARQNPELLAAEAAVRNAEASRRVALSAFLPQLSLAGSVTQSGSPSRDTYSAGLNATENLFAGFRDKSRYQSATAQLEGARATYRATEARISADLKNAFASLLFAQEQVKLFDAILKRRERNVRLVSLRFEGGRENRGSFLLSRASFTQADFERGQALRSIRVNQRQLLKVLGRGDFEPIELKGTFQTAKPSEPRFSERLENIPEVLKARADVRQADYDLSFAEGGWYPSLDLVGSVGRTGSRFFPDQNTWAVGINLTYPFFPGGRQIFENQAAGANLERMRHILRNTENQALLRMEQAFTALTDAVLNREVAVDFLKALEARSTIATGKYTTGMMSFEDWDVIENDRISREKNALITQRDAAIAESAWEQATGQSALDASPTRKPKSDTESEGQRD